MKSLQESLLDDIDVVAGSTDVAVTRESVLAFCKNIIKTGFISRPVVDIDESNITLSFNEYVKKWNVKITGPRHVVILDSGYIIPEALGCIDFSGFSVAAYCASGEADCSLLSHITRAATAWELVGGTERVVWNNIDCYHINDVTGLVFESAIGFNECVEHVLGKNIKFGRISYIAFSDADLRDMNKLPIHRKDMRIQIQSNNCMVGKHSHPAIQAAYVQGLNKNMHINPSGIIVPDIGYNINLENRYIDSDIFKGIKANVINNIHINNLKDIINAKLISFGNAWGDVNIPKNPLSFVPDTVSVVIPSDNIGAAPRSVLNRYCITRLDIECLKLMINVMTKNGLNDISSKNCEYINVQDSFSLSQLIDSIVGSDKDHIDLSRFYKKSTLPKLKYISYMYDATICMLEKDSSGNYWHIMDIQSVDEVRTKHNEMYS